MRKQSFRLARRVLCAWVATGMATVSVCAAPPAPPAPRGPGPKADDSKVKSLRLAIEDLIATFGSGYPRGREYLERLRGTDAANFAKLQREALVANPLVSGRPLLFVARAPDSAGTHEYISPRSFRRPGGALKLLDLKTGKTSTLVAAPKGMVRSPCVHFDGKRIVFAMSRDGRESFHIFEVSAGYVAGSPVGRRPVRQLTSATDVGDVDPIYMPDGSIVFASTRELKYVPCDTQIVPQLFRMSPTGANIHQITRSTAHENQLSVMPDGRILYSRWDYVDRNFGDGHGFWVANPDGTNQAIIWGNNTTHPSAGWSARCIPGTGRLLCILGTHHGSLGGALAVLAPQEAIDGAESIVRTWPGKVMGKFERPRQARLEAERNSVVRLAVETWSPQARRLWANDANMRLHRNDDALWNTRPWYNTPWPLSDKYFLCARAPSRAAAAAICLVDVFGNEIILHKEGDGCFSPMPLAPSPRPPAIPVRRDYRNGDGVFYVQNVYEGTHMKGVKRGQVKAIRVVEVLSKRGRSQGCGWSGLGMQTPAMNWTEFNAKRILGTAPVEKDGSAHFAVPSDRFVYFQLLDADGMMVQSMRSGTSIHSGETLGCVGCHESRLSANTPAGTKRPSMAARRAPSKLAQWYGPPRRFSYRAEVQPVFDKHCIKCHDIGKKGAAKVILAADKTPSFNFSYMELWRKGYVSGVGAGPAGHLPAYSWGSHTSKLIRHLRKGHNKVKLDRESFGRLVTWLDLNGPYYPTTYCAYPYSPPGRCPLDRRQAAALCGLVGIRHEQLWRTSHCTGPMISFDRPELSPCLARVKKDPAKYAKALAIIRAGQEQLRTRPRADMPGFVPWKRDRQRRAHFERYRSIERRAREAILKGRKLSDADLVSGFTLDEAPIR